MLLRIFGYIFGIGAFMLLALAVAAGVLLQQFNAGLPDYDASDPELFERENVMSAKVREMAAQYGERLCGHH